VTSEAIMDANMTLIVLQQCILQEQVLYP